MADHGTARKAADDYVIPWVVPLMSCYERALAVLLRLRLPL